MTKPASASAGPAAGPGRESAPRGRRAQAVTAASAWGLRETDFLSKRPRKVPNTRSALTGCASEGEASVLAHLWVLNDFL